MRKNVEVSYLCGLLHNVGAPVLLNRIAAIDPGLPDNDVQQIVDLLASRAGLILVEEWSLPSAVGVAIRYQGCMEEAKNAKDLVAIVDTGRILSQRLSGVSDEEAALEALPIAELVQLPQMQHLNIYPDDAQELYTHVQHIDEVVRGMS